MSEVSALMIRQMMQGSYKHTKVMTLDFIVSMFLEYINELGLQVVNPFTVHVQHEENELVYTNRLLVPIRPANRFYDITEQVKYAIREILNICKIRHVDDIMYITASPAYKTSGIYAIETGRGVYIGKSKNMYTRLNQHKQLLAAGKHTNTQLQTDYSPEETVFGIVEIVKDDVLGLREFYHIDRLLKAGMQLYNKDF
jgi:hypothetical protein